MAVSRLLGQTILVPDTEVARATYGRLGLCFEAPRPEPERGLEVARLDFRDGTFLELAAPLDQPTEAARRSAETLVRRGEGMHTVHLEAEGQPGPTELHGTRVETHPAPPPGEALVHGGGGAGPTAPGYLRVWNAAVAVRDMDGALPDFEAALGMPVWHRQDQPGWGLATAIFDLPAGGHLELVCALDPSRDTAARIARTVDTVGEGPYMLVLEVADVHAAHAALQQDAAPHLIGPAPIPPGTAWTQEGDQLWVHPRAAHGVFLELISFRGAAVRR